MPPLPEGILAPLEPMRTAFRTAPPQAWLKFLEDYPDQDCATPELAPATVELLALAADVNRRVNALGYRREHRDVWRLADLETFETSEDGFDCEDQALTKRALLARDVPMGALRPALCTTVEPHMVLLLCTDIGEYVLDNGTFIVLPWQLFPATWTARWAGDRWEMILATGIV